jgi:CheY-like chemotaxis protein
VSWNGIVLVDHETGADVETILLVEDDTPVRKLVSLLLRECGYCVLEASGGQEAIAVCDAYMPRIDVLLTDVLMPLMHGPDLADHILARRPAVRVLYISGFVDESTLMRLTQREPSAFLRKPFTAAELKQTLRRLLDGDLNR